MWLHLLAQSMHNSRGLTGWKTEAKGKRKYLKLHISSGFENNSERNVKKTPKNIKILFGGGEEKIKCTMNPNVNLFARNDAALAAATWLTADILKKKPTRYNQRSGLLLNFSANQHFWGSFVVFHFLEYNIIWEKTQLRHLDFYGGAMAVKSAECSLASSRWVNQAPYVALKKANIQHWNL